MDPFGDIAAVLRVQKLADEFAPQLLGGASEQCGHGRIGFGEPTVEVADEDRRGGVVEQRPEA